MKQHICNFISIVFIVAAAGSCASAGGSPAPAVSLGSQPLVCDQPVMDNQQGSPARQVQGSVAVQASITVPQCERVVRVHNRPTQALISIGMGGRTNYHRTEQDVYRVEGETATLTFTITNQSERVFRGRGSLWEATINGVVTPIQLPGLLTLTILPGRSQDIAVRGIRLTEGTYTFALYDVPVARDEAGEVAQVGNFEWLYGLEYERVEGPPAETRRCRVTVAAGDEPRSDYFIPNRANDSSSCPGGGA